MVPGSDAARVRGGLSRSLMLALIVLCLPAWMAKQDLVAEIVVHGNRRIPADTVKARITTRAICTTRRDLSGDFNSLWNTGYFEDIRIEREQTPKGWGIHVYVKEKPTIREINTRLEFGFHQ